MFALSWFLSFFFFLSWALFIGNVCEAVFFSLHFAFEETGEASSQGDRYIEGIASK